MLTRADDGVQQRVCGIVPQYFDRSEDLEVLFSGSKGMMNIKTNKKSYVKLWSVTGVLVGTYDLSVGDNSIATSNMVGIYFLEFVFEDGTRKIEKINIK